MQYVTVQCSGQGISALRAEGLSVYRWSVPEKNKQGGSGNTLVNTPLKFLGLSWKFLEKVIASVIP